MDIRRGEDISAAFDALKGQAQALYVVNDALINNNRVRIHTLSLAARLPTMHVIRDSVEAGGLMSYGANNPDLFRRDAPLTTWTRYCVARRRQTCRSSSRSSSIWS
jgi:putative tryptophan/tyrosine transport system substrate-binding protein